MTVIRGTLSIDQTADALISTLLTPAVTDGRVWKLNGIRWALNMSDSGTMKGHLSGVVSNVEKTASKRFDQLMVDEENLNLINMSLDEGTDGLPSGFKAGPVSGVDFVDEVYLNDEFYLSLITSGVDATGPNVILLAYVLDIDEVKVSSKIQTALLASM